MPSKDLKHKSLEKQVRFRVTRETSSDGSLVLLGPEWQRRFLKLVRTGETSLLHVLAGGRYVSREYIL